MSQEIQRTDGASRRSRPGAADVAFAQYVGGTSASRPRDLPPRALPVALRTAYDVGVTPGRFEPSWSKRFVMVKWVVAGRCELGLHGRRLSFGPGDMAVYTPAHAHAFWAVAARNRLCWITVDGPLAEQVALHLELKTGVYPFGPPPVAEIAAMVESLRDHTIQGRRRSSLLALAMLYEVANRVRTVEVPSTVAQAQDILEQEYADPDLSAKRVADRLGYHRGSLSRLFHRHTGVTLLDYLAQVRLQQAKALLSQTQDKVAEVGRKCGFREPAYFCRWVRKQTGQSPGRLRGSAPS